MYQYFLPLLLLTAFANATTTPLFPIISPSSHSSLAIFFILIGLLVTSYFIVKKTVTKNASIMSEIFIAFIASIFLGIGSLFLLQWTAVFV